jgi:hypothetical protein
MNIVFVCDVTPHRSVFRSFSAYLSGYNIIALRNEVSANRVASELCCLVHQNETPALYIIGMTTVHSLVILRDRPQELLDTVASQQIKTGIHCALRVRGTRRVMMALTREGAPDTETNRPAQNCGDTRGGRHN